ncbi:MAG: ATP-binding protein [Deferribacterales bacterium]|nr:ATP-binding protein [Deferribacterales bacterium]
MIIKRDLYLNQLINHRGDGLIKIISGVRRCGKSYLLFELFVDYLMNSGVDKDHIISIQLDNIDDVKYRNPNICNDFVISCIKDKNPYYLLIDEVQLMQNFESVLNGFLRIKNLDVYVSGSNSKFLSSEIVTEFRGRGFEIRVNPLSFLEFFNAKNAAWEDAWDEYITYGGMPALFRFNNDSDKIKYLQNLFKETYLKDIINRNNIQNTEELEELLSIIASNIGCLTNPQKLANTFLSKKRLNLTAPTIKQYLDYFQDAFLVDKVMRYDIKGKRYISTPFKYYFTDVGIRNAVLNFRQQEETHLMENIIYNELKIRGFQVDVGQVEVHEKDDNGKNKERKAEVDFVVNYGSRRCYIQSAYNITSEDKWVQEEKSLVNIKDFFKRIIILNGVKQPYYKENGIMVIGLKNFLIDYNSIGF